MTQQTPLRIIQLTAENIKRLKTIDITPDPTMQIIGGRNAQGKTSVLDAIWFALGGGAAQKGVSKPVREGEDNASVRLDLGDFIITRQWQKDGKSTLKVESAEGARFSSPQSLLDALVGKLSFDPLAFTRLTDREQRATLLNLVDLDIDIDALEQEREALYNERTRIGREARALGAIEVDDDLPREELSASAILQEIQDAQNHNRRIDQAHDDINQLERTITEHHQRIADLTEAIEKARASLRDLVKSQTEHASNLADLGEPRDLTKLSAQLAAIEETNAAIRANKAARERKAEQDRLNQEYAEHTEQIQRIDAAKKQALAAAKFPVEGLGFDERGVTYRGVPFSQASAAEQIRISLAMAMSLNPRLRVIRILDGSLLDDDNLQIIREMAADGGYQVWIERVGDGDDSAVVIEDGEVLTAQGGAK